MAMTPDERAIYDWLLAVVLEELQVLNAGFAWGLAEAQLNTAATSIASSIDLCFSYQYRPGRGPNYRPPSD